MALFTNSHIPFSIRYPAEWKPLWGGTVFRDYEDPRFEAGKRHFGIETRFVDDTSVDGDYHSTCSREGIEAVVAMWCAASEQSYAHIAAGTFNAAHENTYQVAGNQRWGLKNPHTPLWRQDTGSGDGWSAEVVEWIEPFFSRQGIVNLHVRQLMFVQKLSTDRPECTDGATHCYVVARFTYQGDAEYAGSTRALADYSFSTLEWNGMRLDESR